MSTLSAAQLADMVEKAKLFMKLGDDDTALRADAIAVYHDESASATAATVEVTTSAIVLVITGGANAGTDTITFAAQTTLTAMVTAINALAKGWVATLLGLDTAETANLVRKVATSAFGVSNEQVLEVENESLIELLITNMWAGIETGLCRSLLSTSYSELYRIEDQRVLLLEQPQVTQVSRVALETSDGLTVTYAGSDTHARVEVTASAVVLTSRAGATTTTSTIAFSAQATTTAMATAISAVSGWTGTVKNAAPSAYLVRTGATLAKSRTVTLEYWDDWDGDYRVEYDEGVLTFDTPMLVNGFGASRGMALVDYVAGYSSIPADVEQALLEAVQMAFNAGQTDLTLESERLGDYSYKRATGVDSITLDASKSAVAKLHKYARVRP